MIPGLPGGGRMNPRQAKMMMRRMGIQGYEELEGVEEVVIRLADREIVIRDAGVTEMTVQGQKMYQVVGEPAEQAKEGAGPLIPEEDVQLVAERANVSPEEARKALEETGGEPAEAIIRLMGG